MDSDAGMKLWPRDDVREGAGALEGLSNAVGVDEGRQGQDMVVDPQDDGRVGDEQVGDGEDEGRKERDMVVDPEDDERFGDEHVGDGEDDGRVGDDQAEDQVMEDEAEELVETVGTPQSKSYGARITHVVRGPRLSSIFSNPPRVTRRGTVPELRRDSPSTKRKPTLDSPPRARKKAKEEEDLVKKPLPGSSVDVPIDVDNLQVSPRNICLRTCLQSITNPGRHSCHP